MLMWPGRCSVARFAAFYRGAGPGGGSRTRWHRSLVNPVAPLAQEPDGARGTNGRVQGAGNRPQAPATASGAGASAPRATSDAASARSSSVGKLPNSATITSGKNHTM